MKLDIKSAALALSLVIAAPSALAQDAAPAEPAAEQAASRITAHVNGMVCDFCAQAVTRVFQREPGVSTVAVDLDEGTINVTLEPGAAITDERVGELVRDSGYALDRIEREAA